jgi:hypothetical protein
MVVTEDIYEGDDKYRYILGQGRSPLLFLGAKPSWAEPGNPDPTIRFIKSNFDSWIMLNIYPQRRSDGDEVVPESEFDKEKHNKNMDVITKTIEKYGDTNIIRIVAAWGDSIDDGESYLLSCLDEIVEKINKIEKKQIEWYRLGDPTQKGNPKQPMYYLNIGEKNIRDMLERFDINGYMSTKVKK